MKATKIILAALFLAAATTEVSAQKMKLNLTSGSTMEFNASEVKNIEFEEAAKDTTSSTTTDDGTYHNGHEYVDLGLPSGLKWATCNVGAENSYDYGDYYAWGETETKSDYRTSTYKWYATSTVKSTDADGFVTSVTYSGYTKYVSQSSASRDGYKGFYDDKTTLDAEDDVAHVKWGGNWRMPTSREFVELESKCTWTFVSLNGKTGYKVTGPNGKYIFLPAAAFHGGSQYAGSYGNYWSSLLGMDYSHNAMYLYFNGSRSLNMSGDYRTEGRSVRPVCE